MAPLSHKPTDLGLNYLAILETATDIAMGMCYLHDRQIIHSDLKVGFKHWNVREYFSGLAGLESDAFLTSFSLLQTGNVMLKRDDRDERGYIAKLVDFGLSVHIVR